MRAQHPSPPARPATTVVARPRRFRRLVASLIVVSLAGAVSAPALAQQEWLTAEERRQAEARRDRQGALSGELDLLRISDAELEARAAGLSAEVAELEDRTAAAATELEALDARLAELEAGLLDARSEAEARARLARERIVQAYMHPPADTLSTVLGAANPTEAESRRALVDQVAAEDRRVIAESRQAADELARLEEETTAAATTVRDRLRAQEADLERLRLARDEADAVAAALDERIGAVQREVAALEASEADLVALIADRQAAARTTTTTTPPTTAPPGPGSGGDAGTTSTTAPTPSAPGGSLLWPTSGVLTSPYGWRWGAMHRGIDIGAPSGTPIYAAASGTVFFSGWMGGYGYLILIDHNDGRVTAYAHQSSLAVSGGSVGRGQLIGYVGSTGDSTGPHLHFEVRVNGTAVDPLQYLG